MENRCVGPMVFIFTPRSWPTHVANNEWMRVHILSLNESPGWLSRGGKENPGA